MATIRDFLSTFKQFDLDLPKINAPSFEMPEIVIPTEEEKNEYQSARILIRNLASTIRQWRTQLSNEYQPAIIAILYGGLQITVDRLTQESFHGIRIEGTVGGAPCVVLTHQASVQMLCFAEKIENEKDTKTIGFIIDGKELRE